MLNVKKTNEPNIRLMRIVKSRGIHFSEQYYALDWDLENQRLSMYGIIVNPSKLLVDDYKLRQWTKAVQSMSDKFETKDFINYVVREYHCSERTAKNWLKKLVNCEILIRTGHGRYEKKLEIVDEIISAETQVHFCTIDFESDAKSEESAIVKYSYRN